MTGTRAPPVPPQQQPPAALRAAKAVAALVAFIGSLLGVVFVLWPSLKPEAPSPTRSVAVSELRVEQPVTFGAYLRRARQPRGGLEQAVLRERGVLASFDYRITGYKDRELPVAWQLVDARGGRMLEEGDGIAIAALATTDSGTFPVWLPLPRRRPLRVFVQVTLYEPGGAIALRTRRTRTFIVE